MAVFCCCSSARTKSRDHSSRTVSRPASQRNPVRRSAQTPGPLNSNPFIISQPPETRDSPLERVSPVPTDPVQQVQLGQLVVTDDFDSDDEVEPVVPNKSNSTLQLVKTRIRRHISQETLGRGKGRSAVGSSEEEVARRAELKRLMHKRIQEELRSEESRDVSSHVSPTNRTVTSVIDPLPGGGPRDTLEFSFLNALQSDDTDPISPSLFSPFPTQGTRVEHDKQNQNGPGPAERRRLSCPENSSNGMNGTLSSLRIQMRKQSSLPDLPPSPNLLPRRQPSSRGSLASWRLSYSAGQLTDLLGLQADGKVIVQQPSPVKQAAPLAKNQLLPLSVTIPNSVHSLSRSYSSPARHRTPIQEAKETEDHSPMSTWLASQNWGSRSPSQTRLRGAETGLDQTLFEEAEKLVIRRWSSAQNCAVPDVQITQPETVYLHDKDFHKQLDTRPLNPPEVSPRHSDSGHAVRTGNSNGMVGRASSEDDNQMQPELDPRMQTPLEKPLTITDVPRGIATGSSSLYPSTNNSRRASPEPSIVNHQDTQQRSLLGVRLPSFKWLGTPYTTSMPAKSGRNSFQAANQRTTSSLPGTCDRRCTADIISGPVSETSSFVKREDELKSVEKRFEQSHLRKGPSAPITSRFREEFEESEDSLPTQKTSFLAKIHLSIPRRVKLAPHSFDGSVSAYAKVFPPPPLGGQETLGQSTTSGENNWDGSTTQSQPRSLPYTSRDERDTLHLWQRALREEVRLRGQCSDRRGSSSNDCSRTVRTHSGLTDGSIRRFSLALDIPVLGPVDSQAPSPSSPIMHHTEGGDDDTDKAPSEGLHDCERLPEWPASEGMLRASCDRTPEAWARFPSYNREQRNNADATGDLVVGQGFITNDFVTECETAKCETGSVQVERIITEKRSSISPKSRIKNRTVSGRLGKAVKSGLHRLLSTRTADNPQSGKSNQQVDIREEDSLGYPELRLSCLDREDQETQALRQGTRRAEKPTELRARRMPSHELDQGHGLNPIINIITVLQSEGGLEEPSPHRSDISVPDTGPETPANLNVRLQGHYSSNTTERYDTPKSGKSNSCDTSFHSCPAQSRPQSGTMLATEETIYGDARDDIDSKSDDATVIKTSRSASGAAVGAASKFKTWSGRARTQPVLMQSTIEFGRELEGLLQLERERILGRQHGGANRPGLANG